MKVRASLCTQIISGVNTILSCIDTKVIIPTMAKFLHGL